MEIICDCNTRLTSAEEGVNGSDYFECPNCNCAYNVVYSKKKG